MSDQQLIKEILSGDTSAFKILVDKYQGMVFRTAMGFVHSKEDAEDITQEVFIQTFRSLSAFQEKSEFSTWLYRIAVNMSINFVNRNKLRRLLIDAGENLKALLNISSDEKNAHQRLESDERDKMVRDAIDNLPEKQRTAFVLSKYDDLSQREIADLMKISEGAVEQLLQRAKANLQKKLSRLT